MVASKGSLEAKILFSKRMDPPSLPRDSDAPAGMVADQERAKSVATIITVTRRPITTRLKVV
tara:strand:- start:294 stop:479 length:186 start_codon:yes stop_codon:yes gene_type:complete